MVERLQIHIHNKAVFFNNAWGVEEASQVSTDNFKLSSVAAAVAVPNWIMP